VNHLNHRRFNMFGALEPDEIAGVDPADAAACLELRYEKDYVDLGPDHFVKNDRLKVVNRLLKRLGDFGFEVRDVHDKMAA